MYRLYVLVIIRLTSPKRNLDIFAIQTLSSLQASSLSRSK